MLEMGRFPVLAYRVCPNPTMTVRAPLKPVFVQKKRIAQVDLLPRAPDFHLALFVLHSANMAPIPLRNQRQRMPYSN
jgi:hypothetical protein